jgi:hypothetical protein
MGRISEWCEKNKSNGWRDEKEVGGNNKVRYISEIENKGIGEDWKNK